MTDGIAKASTDEQGLGLLWGIPRIAEWIFGDDTPENRRRCYYLCEKGKIPGVKKIGGRFCGSPRVMRRYFES